MKLTAFALAGAMVLVAGAAVASDVMTLNGVRLIDKNADGAYAMDEVRAAVPDMTEETFFAVDTNEDGLLAVDEIIAHIQAGVLRA